MSLFFLIALFISGCVGLYCRVGFSLGMEDKGCSLAAVPELLTAVASLTRGHVVSGAVVPGLWHRLHSGGTRAQLPCGMWGRLGPGIEPMSPALAGGLLPLSHQGCPQICF